MEEKNAKNVERKSGQHRKVLAACCIMCAIGFTIPVTCWTVVMTPIIKELDIGYTQASMYMMGATFACMLSMALAPKFVNKSVRATIVLASVVAAAGFVLLAVAASPAVIIVAGVLAGLAYPLMSLYTAPVLIKNWFVKRQGIYTALAMAFIGVGGVIFSPITTAIVGSAGWRTALVVLAVVEVVVMCIAAAMVHLKPESLGLAPYGIQEVAAEQGIEGATQGLGITFGESFKTPVAWLALVVFLGLGAMATVTTNVNPMIQKAGFTAAAAGVALSFGSLGNITGKLVMGWATDKRGAQFGMLVASLMAIVGAVGYIVSFTVLPNEPFLYLSAFVMGNGCCMATMMPPLVTMGVFGPKDYDRCYGFFSAMRGFMAAIMSAGVGAMVDASGGYTSTLVFWIVACLVMIPVSYVAVESGRKHWAK